MIIHIYMFFCVCVTFWCSLLVYNLPYHLISPSPRPLTHWLTHSPTSPVTVSYPSPLITLPLIILPYSHIIILSYYHTTHWLDVTTTVPVTHDTRKLPDNRRHSPKLHLSIYSCTCYYYPSPVLKSHPQLKDITTTARSKEDLRNKDMEDWRVKGTWSWNEGL